MAVQVSKTRALPHPPTFGQEEAEAAWYEHQERMRPSYISQPAYQYQQPAYQISHNPHAVSPPSTPTPRWSLPAPPPREATRPRQRPPYQQAHQYAYTNGTAPDTQAHGGRLGDERDLSTLDGQRPRMQHLNSAPSRFRMNPKDAYRPFAFDEEMENRRPNMVNGSAFMHKGFFDIMSLVNNQACPSRFDGSPDSGGLRATFSKATGRLRRLSTPVKQAGEDLFFSSPSPLVVKASSPLTQVSSNRLNASMDMRPIPLASIGGPRAQKKRISVDMVGAPKIDTFVHAAHASDAEQAEEILNRWSRDGIGKIADPIWIDRCKEAMRLQYQRNQAEAIAQIQAAMHQDSAISSNPKALQIMNGAPSPSLTASNFTMLTSTTSTTVATVGHGTNQQAAMKYQGIAEEGSNLAASRPATPRKALPPTPPQISRPGMMPRTNTQGTVLIAASPEKSHLSDQEVPDYLQYQKKPIVDGLSSPVKELLSKRSSKAIDGLPGSAGGIDAIFDRPISMVIRDEISADPELYNLAGDRLPLSIAANAGAALRPSLTTVEKSVAAKIFFENLYYGILKKPRDRDTRRAGLERELAGLRISDVAKDAIRAKWAANESEYLRDIRSRVTVNSFNRIKTIGHGAFGVVALVREQASGQLYAMKQLRKADMLRKGQEGHVRAERDLMTSASASTNAKWIVKLIYSFQDVDHLYLIMEFMGGGDLLNLLIEKDIFAEDFARFYVAEMILAINEAHRLGYIHRDIKPDNFLFTSQGHIKLADFGLCQSFHWAHDGAYYDQQRRNLLKKHGIDLEDSEPTRTKKGLAAAARLRQETRGGDLNERELGDIMSDRNEDGTPLTHVLTWRDKNKKKIAYSVVGTNNYMAPEVLRGLGYDQSCDWWSLGVIVFEMIYGYPPFVSKSRHMTRQKILNWKQTLKFPPKPKVSREAQDFISRLICEKDDRLGSMNNASVSRPNSLLQGSRQPSGFANTTHDAGKGGVAGLTDGVEDLMAHPWFRGIDWNRIHTSKAPFKPALSHPADTKHFEDDIEDEPLPAPGVAEAAKDGKPIPLEQPRDPMLRDKAHGGHLLEMRKQLAFVGYTFKSPKAFDPKTQLTESKIIQVEEDHQESRCTKSLTEGGSRLRSMSM